MTITEIKDALERALELHLMTTAVWHMPGADHDADPLVRNAESEGLAGCIVGQHVCNFKLWHIEDMARRQDVDATVIADCKRRIDTLNQQRNDGMERVDKALLTALRDLLPPVRQGAEPRYNTESLGMVVDRLSILSLKIWHMDEQLLRTDVDAEHIRSCADKAAVLREQRTDLQRSVMQLLDEFVAGTKQPRLYFQFKMYNDPRLNPELYTAKG